MKITDIQKQKKNPKRYSVFLDGEFAFGIDGPDLLFYRLEVGQTLHKELYEKLRGELEFAHARDVAVRYLGRGAKSIKQVRDKLTERELSLPNIERVIDLLVSRSYLDDVAFAAAFIAHKTKVKNYGRRRIEQELRQKGVSNKDIQAAYASFDSEDEGSADDSELDAAKRALDKKLRNKNIEQILADPKEVQRLKSFLARRGFDFDLIDQIVVRKDELNGFSR
jgi:regulatory protein